MSMLVTTLYSIMPHRAMRSTMTSLGSTERIEVRGHHLPEVQQKVLHLKYKLPSHPLVIQMVITIHTHNEASQILMAAFKLAIVLACESLKGAL